MKKAHVNTVTLGVFSWSTLEPQEGVFELDWLADIIHNLYANGIYTILATPSAARPAWMAHKYPEVRRVRADHPEAEKRKKMMKRKKYRALR